MSEKSGSRETSRRRLVALGLMSALVLLGCGQRQPSPSSEPRNPFYVDPATQDFSQNPALLERIRSSPHGYLRFVNILFSQEVCRDFGDTLDGVPLFNLHGDAHLEQYAVTDLGRGLTDFDDSSTGPAVVDLLRLGVSLYLACDTRGWGDQADALYEQFLRGYRAALEDPEIEAPTPAVVRRLAADFEHDRERYFEWVDSIVEPVPNDEKRSLLLAMASYVEAMLATHEGLEPEFFYAVDVGYLRLGIGSALDRKYLVRIRGDSDEPTDDVVLELKQVRDLTGIDCIADGKGTDPFRILVGQARIAYQPYGLLGYVRFDGLTFWIHAWVDNYSELSIADSFRTPEELAEVVYDVGVQLGRGHPNQIGAPLDLQLRQEQLRVLERDEQRIKLACRSLADQVTAAWQQFRSASS